LEADSTTTASALLALCRAAGLKLATAESCTGGIIAAALTDIPGSSEVLERGVVTYSNASKSELLGVPSSLITRHGAVSAEVAEAMALGALARAPVDLALAVTGIAGPGGATPTKPVGLVYLAAIRAGEPARVERHVFSGDRHAIRAAAAARGLELLMELVSPP